MKRIIFTAALALPLVTAGLAGAGELTKLTDAQMDGVSAGVIANAGGLAIADALGDTTFSQSATSALVQVLVVDPISGLQGAVSTSAASAAAAAN